MAHIECFSNNGIRYLRICEGHYSQRDGRQKKVVLKNLGPLSRFDDGQEGFLDRIREQFRKGEVTLGGTTYKNSGESKRDTVVVEFDRQNDSQSYADPKNIGYFYLEGVYNSLGIYEVMNRVKSDSKIEYDLNGICKLLVFNRVLCPSSKKSAFERRDEYLFPVAKTSDINEIYRALDVLDKKAMSVQRRMDTRIRQSAMGRDTELTYYDITNYYFETMYGDEDEYATNDNGERVLGEDGEPIFVRKALRKKGVSKENRNEPIVQMGLFIDRNGIPVSYRLFPGNTQDRSTFSGALEQFPGNVNDKSKDRIVVVADNGINCQQNLHLLVSKGHGYIVSKSVKRCWKSYKGWILDTSDYKDIYNDAGEVVFRYKSRIINRTLKGHDGSDLEVQEKEIVYWSLSHYKREAAENKKFLEYLESCVDNPDKLRDKQRKSQEFIKVLHTDPNTGKVVKTKDVVVILQDKIEKYRQSMGYYMLITSETENEDTETINRYHGLSRIEDSFRIIKSDLEGRPIYVRKDEHINAHFLICFIALTIIRMLQYKVLKYQGEETLNTDGWKQGITAETLKEALSNLEADSFPQGYYRIHRRGASALDRLFSAVGVSADLRIPTESELHELRQKIITASSI